MRDFRPDVILSVFSGTPSDGHGQHQAAGIMAREAFEAAADPRRFPGQIARGLRPHETAKLYQALWRRDDGATVFLETGELDPLFGRSYYQAAMASRSRHRSQDMGQILEAGPQTNALRLMESRVGGEDAGLFAGIDTTLAGVAAALAGDAGSAAAAEAEAEAELLRAYERAVYAAREGFNPLRPTEIVPELIEALSLLHGAEEALADRRFGPDLSEVLADEREELVQAITLAAGLRVDAVAAEETVVPGESFEVTATLWNGGAQAVSLGGLNPVAPGGWAVKALDELPASIAPGTLVTQRLRVTVPAGAEPTEPYFLRLPRAGDMYRWPEERGGVGIPFEAPVLQLNAEMRLDGVPLEIPRAVTYRGLDKMVGEFRRPLRVVPAVEVELEPGQAILPLSASGEPRHFTVRLRSEAPGGIAGTLRLRAPEGWTVEPAAMPLSFAAPGRSGRVEVVVRAPAGMRGRVRRARAAFEAADGRTFARGYELVDYPHTRPRPLYRPADATAARARRAAPHRSPGRVRGGPRRRGAGGAGAARRAADAAGADGARLRRPRRLRRDRHRHPRLRGAAGPAHPQRAAPGLRARAAGRSSCSTTSTSTRSPGIAPFPVKMVAPSRPGDRRDAPR